MKTENTILGELKRKFRDLPSLVTEELADNPGFLKAMHDRMANKAGFLADIVNAYKRPADIERVYEICARQEDHRITSEHQARVKMITAHLLNTIGVPAQIGQSTLKGALIHDVGKYFIEPELMYGNGLNPGSHEYMLVREGHGVANVVAADLMNIYGQEGDIIRRHHDGYPLKGKSRFEDDLKYLLPRRAMQIADSVDAAARGGYQKQHTPEEAVAAVKNRILNGELGGIGQCRIFLDKLTEIYTPGTVNMIRETGKSIVDTIKNRYPIEKAA